MLLKVAKKPVQSRKISSRRITKRSKKCWPSPGFTGIVRRTSVLSGPSQGVLGIPRGCAEKRHVLQTPCVASQTLSQITGAQVYLKFENLQFTASFKERGACNRLQLLSSAQKARGVVAMSAGNHAQGVAYHAQRMGVRAVIVMPRFTPGVKVERTRSFGAEVVLYGDTLEAARQHAYALAEQEQLPFIHPFDDPAASAGQGTLPREMRAERPDLDTLIVSVGGGGLIAGVATAAKALKPNIRVVGVQTQRFPSMLNAVQGLNLPIGPSTIAEGIAVATAGQFTRQVVRNYVDTLLLVDEGDV